MVSAQWPLSLELVFRAPNFICPSSRVVLLSSCFPLHLLITHTHPLQLSWIQWLPDKVWWTRVGLSFASYLAPTSDSLAMRSEKSLCVNCQMGSMGMVLHAVGLCPSRALEQRSQPLPQPGPTLWHLPTRLTFHSRNQRSTLGLINPLTPLTG